MVWWAIFLALIGLIWILGKPKPEPEPVQEKLEPIPTDLTEYQLWCVGLAGILTEVNHYNHDSLGYREIDAQELEALKQYLEEERQIYNREDLLSALDWLGCAGGHNAEFMEYAAWFRKNPGVTSAELMRMGKAEAKVSLHKLDFVRKTAASVGEKGISAWDYGLSIDLCRTGFMLGYLERNEALTLIEEAGLMVREQFTSWAEYGESFILGWCFWVSDDPKIEKQLYQQAQSAYRELFASSGVWNRIPWNRSNQIKGE